MAYRLGRLQEAFRIDAVEVDDANPRKDAGEAARVLFDIEHLQPRQIREARLEKLPETDHSDLTVVWRY